MEEIITTIPTVFGLWPYVAMTFTIIIYQEIKTYFMKRKENKHCNRVDTNLQSILRQLQQNEVSINEVSDDLTKMKNDVRGHGILLRLTSAQDLTPTEEEILKEEAIEYLQHGGNGLCKAAFNNFIENKNNKQNGN